MHVESGPEMMLCDGLCNVKLEDENEHLVEASVTSSTKSRKQIQATLHQSLSLSETQTWSG
jgi:hypothetical protein